MTRSWDPAEEVKPEVRALLASCGLEVQAEPRRFDLTEHEIETMHVIVCLDGTPCEGLGRIPFRTVLLEWALEAPGSDREALEATFAAIKHRIGELIELLRGEDEAR